MNSLKEGNDVRFCKIYFYKSSIKLQCQRLIPSEDVTGVYLVLHVIKDRIIAVGDDGLGVCLESGKIVHHTTAEEGRPIL